MIRNEVITIVKVEVRESDLERRTAELERVRNIAKSINSVELYSEKKENLVTIGFLCDKPDRLHVLLNDWTR